MVVANQRLTEENKKLEEKISQLSDDLNDVEMQLKGAAKQAETRVAMMATSKSREFFYATNRPAVTPTEIKSN